MDFSDSTILITGANRGIGKAYVEAFLRANARKIYLGVRDKKSVSDMVAGNPEKLVPLELDVTNHSQIDAAAKIAIDVTILVNNAGILFFNSLQSADSIKQAHAEMEVNYFGPLALTRAFAPILKANGGGAIVTVSSIAGHLSFPGLPTYCASKAAAHSLVMAARMELANQNTLVIGVYPGPIDTDMAKDVPMEKYPPSQVADATINAIVNRIEDVFPDDFSKQMYDNVKKSPKDVEAQMLDMYRQSQ